MKKVKQKIFGTQELRKSSLTVKWAFASSFFIFVVFTIFAVTTYQSSVTLFVEKEKNNAEQVTSEIVYKLGHVSNELSLVNTYEMLTNSEVASTKDQEQSSTIEGILMNIDPFISELGRSELTLYVYNLDKELVFKTRERDIPLTDIRDKDATVSTVQGLTGFISVHPIYSIETGEKIGYAQTFYELTSFYQIRNRLLIILIILEIVSFVVSSVLGYLLSSYYLKPIKVLRDTMEKIQEDPQSNIHTPDMETNDELADLSKIFNRMLDRMRSYTEQQEQFVEDVSHELRTPVAIIEGHLNMLNRWGKDDPEILEESLDASMQEISRMKTLVQEMLDLSRAEQVDVYYGNETTQAKEVVYQVYNNFKMLYGDFVFILDDDLSEEKTIKIYRNHFEQILIILLDNAIKYSTDRQEVHLSLSSNAKEVEIVIQDFGEGISEEDLKKVFNRFYRVDKARSRNKGGNGLGLAIAQKLLESYQGRIMVQSSLGQGTLFRIYLPIEVNASIKKAKINE